MPTACKALIPLSAILDDAGETVDPTAFAPGLTPPSFADTSNGALRCLWAGYDVYDPATAAIEISIVPRVSRAVFDAYRAGIGWPETVSSVAPDAYTYCTTAGHVCGFHELTPDYAIVGFAWNLHTKPPEGVRASAQDLLRRVNSVVATLPAPKP
ncbi:hypothetical protein G3T36_15815 [Diaminobutyricibacter tongyongensis]|uniref:DUF3558 domain-containing protein n=1 Tax=Leifsonia tongyongensis TaxID=1268043 RepID=A0A6L9Y1Q4_9MICO|nr:hypothetical protein [Diaminobutyricibacter tongyongensis]NEN07327.1 hypothetical protein [Diaminobutyricibacter tongyongensis]